MLQMPNPDLLRAMRRVAAEDTAEGREAAHRRTLAQARRDSAQSPGQIVRARLRVLLARLLRRGVKAGGRSAKTGPRPGLTCPAALAGTA
ncbi:hypothetical protein [Neotabrizicola sp. sgz301269]|uniref:hypothetical protein n=1 Tax=Neotabrizicola sp. sgz301269 TaxID=3276282 RepID=UPI00376F47BD